MHAFIAVAVGSLMVTVSAAAQTALSEDELRQTFVGKKVEWTKVGITEYKTDGTYEFYSFERNKTFTGKLKYGAGTICYGLVSGGENCDQIFRDAKGIFLKSPKGNISYASIK